MSDKTLVERLRDMVDESDKSAANSITEYVYPVKTKAAEDILGRPCVGRQGECELFMAIADAIEREYLPRPLFEDGEPVQFGDMAEVREDLGDVFEMVYQDGKCVEVVIAFGDEETASHYMVCEGERIKRPEPEVLDADGVPIRKGDTVWRTDEINGKSRIVKDFYKDGSVVTDYEGTIPVCVNPKNLTHKQPDSLELVETDIAEWCIDHAVKGGIVPVNEWVERIKALLERDHER